MFFLKKRGGAALPAKRGELSCGAWSLPLPATQPGYSWMSYWLPLLPEVGLLNRDWRGPAGTKCPFLPVVAPRWWGWENNFSTAALLCCFPPAARKFCEEVIWAFAVLGNFQGIISLHCVGDLLGKKSPRGGRAGQYDIHGYPFAKMW